MQRHVDVARQLRIDRHVIVLAGKLHTKTGQIDHRYRVRTGGRYLPEKFADRFAQCCLIEIACTRYRKPRGRQRVGDEAGIIGGRRELR